MSVIKRSNSNGSMTIDLWYDDPFTPKRYWADAYVNSDGSYAGNIHDGVGMTIGDYTATDSTIIEDNFIIDWDLYSDTPDVDAYYQVMNILDACAKSGGVLSNMDKATLDGLLTMVEGDIEDIADANDCGECHTWDEIVEALKELFVTGERVPVKSSTDTDGYDHSDADIIHFYYNGQKLGDTTSDDLDCPALLSLIENDREAAKTVLDYLNSGGDPVYPVSEEDWDTPETNPDKIDAFGLYSTFMQEIGYEYDDYADYDDGFCVYCGKFEIFTGEEAIKSSAEITSAIKNMHGKVNESDYRTGYLYLLKHGIGPGVLPKDINVLKTQDLPNHWTAVWLDSVLTAAELKEYDIPSETELRSQLSALGYELNDHNEIIPIEACDGINASTKITANTSIGWQNYGDANPLERGRIIKNDGNGLYKMLYIEPVYDTDDDRNLLAAWLWFDFEDAADGWITDDLSGVADSMGSSVEDLMADPMYLFECCVDYFSLENFSPAYIGANGTEYYATEAEVEEALASIGY